MTVSSSRPRSTIGRPITLVLAALALVLGLLAAGAGSASSTSGEGHGQAAPKPTIVLVHGVFADASGWNATIERLQRAGYPVIAPANPLRNVTDDSAYISSVVDTIPGPVIMVGHSYGGAVITNAALGHANVKALVYIGAFAPDQGETALGLADRYPGSKLKEALLTRDFPLPGGSGHDTDGYIAADRFHDVFAQDLSRSTTRLMAATQRPGSLGGLSTPSGVPAWKSIPSWYLIPTADNVIPPAVQHFMAERAGSHVTEVRRASHVVMMSQPGATVKIIDSAHRATR